MTHTGVHAHTRIPAVRAHTHARAFKARADLDPRGDDLIQLRLVHRLPCGSFDLTNTAHALHTRSLRARSSRAAGTQGYSSGGAHLSQRRLYVTASSHSCERTIAVLRHASQARARAHALNTHQRHAQTHACMHMRTLCVVSNASRTSSSVMCKLRQNSPRPHAFPSGHFTFAFNGGDAREPKPLRCASSAGASIDF